MVWRSMIQQVWQAEGNNLLLYLREEVNVVLDKEYLQQFTGQYYSSHLDYYFRIVLDENGKLKIKRPTVPDTFMEPDIENRFIIEQKNGSYSVYMKATFTKNKRGKVDGINLQYSRLIDHRFVKVK